MRRDIKAIKDSGIFIKAIAAILLTALILCSCEGVQSPAHTDSKVSFTSERGEERSEEAFSRTDSEGFQEETSDTASEETSGGAFEETSEPSSEDIALAEKKEDIIRAASKLLESDALIIDLFAGGKLYREGAYEEGEIFSEYGTEYVKVKEDNEFAKFSAVEELLAATYSPDSDTASKYLFGFPEYGMPAITDTEGSTFFTFHYICGFKPEPQKASLAVLTLEGDKATVSYQEGGDIFEIGITETDEGYRLDDSLLFLWREASRDAAKSGIGESLSTLRGEGSAKALKGDCLIFNVFVDDAESVWGKEDIDDVIRMTEEAAKYLEIRFESESDLSEDEYLEIEVTGSDDSAYISLDGIAPNDSDGMLWLDEVLTETVYGSANGLAEYYLKDYKYDNVCLTFHYNKRGRSYATQYDPVNTDCDIYYYERAQLFYSTDESYDYWVNTAVYAHEILHLFGADDLYEPIITERRLALIEAYFPYEIMRYEPSDIYEAVISPLTAYLIGWTNYLPDQLKFHFEALG